MRNRWLSLVRIFTVLDAEPLEIFVGIMAIVYGGLSLIARHYAHYYYPRPVIAILTLAFGVLRIWTTTNPDSERNLRQRRNVCLVGVASWISLTIENIDLHSWLPAASTIVYSILCAIIWHRHTHEIMCLDKRACEVDYAGERSTPFTGLSVQNPTSVNGRGVGGVYPVVAESSRNSHR